MYYTNKITRVLFLLILAGCSTLRVPEAYQFKPSQIQNNPFGCWMECTVISGPGNESHEFFSGELLAINHDTLFLLNEQDTLNIIETKRIATSTLCTHKNQGQRYFLISTLLAVPGFLGALIHTDYANGFLQLALPSTIAGIVQGIVQSTARTNELVYPAKNSLAEFIPFARFPAGLPENVETGLLKTKKQ